MVQRGLLRNLIFELGHLLLECLQLLDHSLVEPSANHLVIRVPRVRVVALYVASDICVFVANLMHVRHLKDCLDQVGQVDNVHGQLLKFVAD